MATHDGRAPDGGPWTEAAIRARLEEAAETMRRLRAVRYTTPPGYISSWPEVVRNTWESLAQDRVARRPPPPQGRAIDRMDEALAWIDRIGDDWEIDRLVRRYGHRRAAAERRVIDRRRIVWARACRVPWRRLADRDGRSRTTLHTIQREGLEAIARWLNSGRTCVPEKEHFALDRSNKLG